MMNEEIQAAVEWYRRIPEEMKRVVAFRHERMKDASVVDLYGVFVTVEKLSKEAKRECR